MKLRTRDDREVEVAEMHLAGDLEDAAITKAYYVHPHEGMAEEDGLVPDEVINELNEDNFPKIEEEWNNYHVNRAEALADSLEDR